MDLLYACRAKGRQAEYSFTTTKTDEEEFCTPTNFNYFFFFLETVKSGVNDTPVLVNFMKS